MEDLIKRSDAASVLEVFTEKDALGHTPKQIVEALPSAQPDMYQQGWKDGQEALREEVWEYARDRLD